MIVSIAILELKCIPKQSITSYLYNKTILYLSLEQDAPG
jgi:hypothetical protein